MIKKSQAETIKEILGPGFLLQIADRLFEKRILSYRGKPFTSGYLSGVLNGNHSNTEVEDAIWELFEERTKQLEEKKQRREAAIEAAKELTNG
ncbi:hypothetical protein [Aequorivita echinoideorum]|uniref:Uncharacterized protein n=1 Tax=Aequorivita echinoideorum TaxID=1549647 RepID=A0ABS5S324_9FLAO|nr:hypothetical protein [Aequorivita echinoideorum]MBT0607607.1 hypothetical protein [Aequorivita echinoideorum]